MHNERAHETNELQVKCRILYLLLDDATEEEKREGHLQSKYKQALLEQLIECPRLEFFIIEVRAERIAVYVIFERQLANE